MESKLVISDRMMHSSIQIYHVFNSYEHFHLLTTDGRTYVQDRYPEVPYGNLSS